MFLSIMDVRIYYHFPTIDKTGKKPCSIRVQIIGIAVVSERDFDNMTCV